MYLFTRTGRLGKGTIRESLDWAVGITEKVNQIVSIDVSLWTTILSPANGTLVWSSIVPDLQSLEDADSKLMVDDVFVSMLDKGTQLLENGVDDKVAQLVAGEVDPERNPQYVTVVTSELNTGGFAKGVAAGIEIAQRATAITGLPTSFLVSSTGKYGGVSWVSPASSLAELEAAEAKINGDLGFIAYIDEVAPAAFVPGITTQTIYRRIV